MLAHLKIRSPWDIIQFDQNKFQLKNHPDIVDPEERWPLDLKGFQQSAYSSWRCDVAPDRS